MHHLSRTKRRATLLLMVVGLLASLFIIISAFLTLARSDNRMLQSTQRADDTQAILHSADNIVLSAIRRAWEDGQGNLLTGGWKDPASTSPDVLSTYSPEDVAGTRGTSWLGGAEVVRNHGLPSPPAVTPGSIHEMRAYWQTFSSLDGATTPRQLPLLGWGPQDSIPWTTSILTQRGLMLENPTDIDGVFAKIPGADDDIARNARRPFMDADADGVADSFFIGMRPLTEMANAIAGASVPTPPEKLDDPTGATSEYFNPSDMPSTDDPSSALRQALAAMWQRFDEQAKYELAVKIESNGGKVGLASPGTYDYQGSVWNREFVVGMFNWIRHQNDLTPMPIDPQPPDYPTFNDIQAAASATEPYLRYRGGLLPTYLEPRPYSGASVRPAVPNVLTSLEQSDGMHFPWTFIPDRTVGTSTDRQWQRFNFTLPNEFSNWRAAAAIDADAFNYGYSSTIPPLPAAPTQYSRRRLLTTMSYSDDLARDLDPRWPDLDISNPDRAHPPDNPPGSSNYLDADMGIYAGALKLYLGDIAQAFDYSSGLYNVNDYKGGTPVGNKIVRRLANYYYEMLTPYADWGNVQQLDDYPTSADYQAVSRRQQAFMLAVNTVAFAAPRTTDPRSSDNGFIDAVWYQDTEPPPSGAVRQYVGYAPQLFITEAIAYCEGDDDSDPDHIKAGQMSVAVELYNPNEPDPSLATLPNDPHDKFAYGDDGRDRFALDLNQFGLSISAPDAPLAIHWLTDPDAAKQAPGRHLTGRSFMAVSLDDGLDALRSRCDINFVNVMPETYLDPQTGKREIVVRLWRRGNPNSPVPGPWLIDRMVIGDGNVVGDSAHTEIPAPVASGAVTKEKKWIVDYYRDCMDEPHFRRQWPGGQVPARWRMATNLHGGDGDEKEPDSGHDVDIERFTINLGWELPSTSFAPTVPLYTMNAGEPSAASSGAPWWRQYLPDDIDHLPAWFFTPNPVHGAYRPMSFPTVGFMHFIPRFSHVMGAKEASMPDVLWRQWRIWDHRAGSSTSTSTATSSSAGSSGVAGASAGPSPGSGGSSGSTPGGSSSSDLVWDAARGEYPADFGHMPVFNNQQKIADTTVAKPYFDDSQAGRIPWGLLVYDYFTTVDPKFDGDRNGQPDVDPRRIPGRIDINTAPWYILAGLPVINPQRVSPSVEIERSASPAFWSEICGILVGAVDSSETAQVSSLPGGILSRFPLPGTPPGFANNLLFLDTDAINGWLRLGPYYAQAIASYRDQLRLASDPSPLSSGQNPLWFADRRNSISDADGASRQDMQYRLESSSISPPGDGLGGFLYGAIRRGDGTSNPFKYGFISLGELANVKGFDSPVYTGTTGARTEVKYNPLGQHYNSASAFIHPDFFKAVSLLALLDTNFLTTRSNTFTVYMTLMNRDPDQQQSSVRVQYTVDRSNLLPQLAIDPVTGDPLMQTTQYGGTAPIVIQPEGLPEIIARRESGYYDMQYGQ